MEDHKKVLSIQIPIEVEVEVLKLHFEANTEVRMVDIINMKLSLMEVDEEILEEEEVVEVMVEVIEIQQPNNNSNCYYCGKPGHMAKNYYQKEHDARNGNCNKGIMHQLAIKVMNNYL